MLTLKILNRFNVSKSAKKKPTLEAHDIFRVFSNNIITNIILKSLNNIKVDTLQRSSVKMWTIASCVSTVPNDRLLPKR